MSPGIVNFQSPNMWSSWRSYGGRCRPALWEPYHGGTWWAGICEGGYSSHTHLLSLHGYSKMCPKLGIWIWRPKSMFIWCQWLEWNFHPLEEQGLSQSSPREYTFPTICSLLEILFTSYCRFVFVSVESVWRKILLCGILPSWVCIKYAKTY